MKEFAWHVPEMPEPEMPSKEFLEELDWRLAFALGSLVKPTIKGEVTKGKLRWRGIKRYSTFIYGDWAYEFYIEDNGSFKVNAIGRPIEPHPELTYPTILQRKIEISLEYENDFNLFMLYDFWKNKMKCVTFGISSRRDVTYTCSGGIMEQIEKCKKS